MSSHAELDVLLRSGSFVPTLGLASIVLLVLSGIVFLLRHRKTAEPSAVATGKALQQNVVADRSEPSGPKVTLLYGTQTGTAERFAKQLKNEMTTRYGESNQYAIVDIEEYKAEEVLCKEKLVFFLMATYGDGEPTDNAADFYNWLIKAGKEAETGEGQTLLKVCRTSIACRQTTLSVEFVSVVCQQSNAESPALHLGKSHDIVPWMKQHMPEDIHANALN